MKYVPILIALVVFTGGCATTVDRDELGLEVTLGSYDPTPGQWYYMGSAQGYHYFRKENFVSGGNGVYRIPAADLKVDPETTLTRDRAKWRRAEKELEPLKRELDSSGRRQPRGLERVAAESRPRKDVR